MIAPNLVAYPIFDDTICLILEQIQMKEIIS